MTIGWGPIDLMAAVLNCSFYILFMDVLFNYSLYSQLNSQIYMTHYQMLGKIEYTLPAKF